MTENQIYIKELYERARKDGLVKNQSMFAEEIGINRTVLSQILSEDKTVSAYDAYYKARNWEKGHYPPKPQVTAAVDSDWVVYRRDLARAITERLISQPAAWSCDKRELVKEAVEVTDMLIKELKK